MKDMKEESSKGSRKSTSHGRPQSILLQKVSTDHQEGTSRAKSERQIKLEQERQKLEDEKAQFEEWKKRFMN